MAPNTWRHKLSLAQLLKGILISLFLGGLLLSLLSYRSWWGVRAEIILSASMQPTLPVGSLILSKQLPPEHYRVGDIITFQLPGKESSLVTHRIIRILASDRESIFQTKGDANTNGDPWLLHSTMIVGREIIAVPGVGYLIQLVRTQLGFLVLALIFFLFFVYGELLWWRVSITGLVNRIFS